MRASRASRPKLNRTITIVIVAAILGSILLGLVFSVVESGEFPAGALVVLAFLVGGYFLWRYVRRQEYRKAVIYQRFANDNRMRYIHHDVSIPQLGAIFTAGHSKYRQPVLEGEQFEFGNYHYTTGSGRNQRNHTCV